MFVNSTFLLTYEIKKYYIFFDHYVYSRESLFLPIRVFSLVSVQKAILSFHLSYSTYSLKKLIFDFQNGCRNEMIKMCDTIDEDIEDAKTWQDCWVS